MFKFMKIKSILLLITVLLFLNGCKIDFSGDLYTSDLLAIANEGGSINLPMEIRFSDIIM